MGSLAKDKGDLPFALKSIFAGGYRIDRILGRGAVGVIAEAVDVASGERVSLRIFNPEFNATAELRERFIQQAKAATAIENEHVAKIVAVKHEDGVPPFVVMESLSGADLSEVLASNSPLDLQRCADILIEACEALFAAHAQRQVHQSIRPTNLFLANLAGSESLKLLDLGTSLPSLIGSASLLETCEERGSKAAEYLRYLAPEQLDPFAEIDERADIWSLGTVMYELFYGESPFLAATADDTKVAILAAAPSSPALHPPAIPKQIQSIIRRCLKRNPSERFSDIYEVAISLLPFATKRARAAVERMTSLREDSKPSSKQSMNLDAGAPPARELVRRNLEKIGVVLPSTGRAPRNVPQDSLVVRRDSADGESPSWQEIPDVSAGLDAEAPPAHTNGGATVPSTPPPPFSWSRMWWLQAAACLILGALLAGGTAMRFGWLARPSPTSLASGSSMPTSLPWTLRLPPPGTMEGDLARAHASELQSCGRAISGQASSGGAVAVRATWKNGRVISALVEASTMEDTAVASCILRQIETWTRTSNVEQDLHFLFETEIRP